MGNENKKRFVNIYFNRFVAEAIENISTDVLPFLDSADRRNIVKKRTFLKNGSLEEKLLLLGKIGYSFVLFVGDKKKEHSVSQLLKMFRIFISRKFFDKKQAVREMKDAGAFAICDLDVVRSMRLAANIYNTPIYNMVNTYSSVSEKLFAYQQDTKKLAREISAAAELDELIIRGIHLGMRASVQSEFEAMYHINYKQFLALAHLSKKRTANLRELEAVVNGRKTWMDMQGLTTSNLVDAKNYMAGLVKRHDYSITGLGENVLIEARKYFIKHMA